MSGKTGEAFDHHPPAAEDLKRRSVRGATAVFIAQGVRFVIQFATQVALARLLTPVQFGLVAMVAPLVGFVQLFADLGLTQAVIQRPSLSHHELSSLFWINAGASLALALLLVLGAPLVAAFYGVPETAGITASLALPLLLGGLAAQHMALMSRHMRFTALAAIDVASTAAAAAAGVLSARCGLGYWSLVVMQVANATVTVAVAWVLSGWRPALRFSAAAARPLVHFGGNVTGYNLVNYLSFNLDNVLIGRVRGGAALGLYDRAFRLMLPSVMQLTLPFTRITVPLLSRLQDEPERYRRIFGRILSALLLATLPGLGWSIVMADPIITVLLGRRWEPAAPILAALGVGALLLPLSNSMSWLFISQARTREQMVWGAVGAAVMLASFVAGLPWGPVGVATASAVFAWLIGAPLLLWAGTRRGPVRLRDLAGAVYPVAAAVGLAGVVIALPGVRGWPAGLLGLACSLVASYALTGACLVCLPAGNRLLQDLWQLRHAFRDAAT